MVGWYFVTVCSNNKENIFGEYKNSVGEGLASSLYDITLSNIGEIINKQWNNVKNQYDNIESDQYIIMPNHIHGILIIDKREDARPSPTISDIMCAFKSKCTVEYIKYIEQNNLNISGKIWQRSFHDRIIRNDKSLDEIQKYIINNPANWDTDENNIKNKSNHNNALYLIK